MKRSPMYMNGKLKEALFSASGEKCYGKLKLDF